MATREEHHFQEDLQQIDALIGKIEQIADPAARANVERLVQSLMALHGSGLERMLDMIWESGEAGSAIIDAFARDEQIGGLLLLYGLHPLDLEERVHQALDKVRPYLRSHGGNVELLGISEDGSVRLRLQGSCHGCPSSAMTLKLAIEEALYAAAPDIAALDVEGVVDRTAAPPGVIPLEAVSVKRPSAPAGKGWEQVGDLASLGQGALRRMDVSGRPVLFCRLDESFYAYGDACPSCGRTLSAGRLEASALVCPGCGQRYDVLRAGRGLDLPDLHLEPFPLLVEQGRVKVALPR